MDYTNTTIIIPTLNEEETLPLLIKQIKKQYKKINIIISDDGSEDQTKNTVKKIKNTKFLDRSKEGVKGLTASVIAASKLVHTTHIIVMDADLQHPTKKIKEIVCKLKKGFDIVIATRKRTTNLPIKRIIISKIATLLGKIRLRLNGLYLTDPLSGFFGIKTKLLKIIIMKNEGKFEKKGYKILFDILKYCKKVKISEVYYDFGGRRGGHTKIGKKQIISYIRALLK